MKKKYFCALLALILCMAFAFPGLANAPITIKVNGTTLQPDVPPQIINGRTMVPLSAIAGSLDCDVQWLPELQQVNITSKTTTSNMTIAITGPDDFRQVIQEVLDKMDNKTRSFVTKYIKRMIWLDDTSSMPSGSNACMDQDYTCKINGPYFTKAKTTLPHDQLIYGYIAFLTHEANHSCLYHSGAEPIYSDQDQEALCDFAALRAVKLAGGKNGSSYKILKQQFQSELQY